MVKGSIYYNNKTVAFYVALLCSFTIEWRLHQEPFSPFMMNTLSKIDGLHTLQSMDIKYTKEIKNWCMFWHHSYAGEGNENDISEAADTPAGSPTLMNQLRSITSK